MALNQVIVDLILNTQNFTTGLKTATTSMQQSAQQMQSGTSNVSSGFQNATKSAQGFWQKLFDIETLVQKTALFATYFVSVQAVTSAIGGAIMETTNFDKALRNVQSITKESDASIRELGNDLLKMVISGDSAGQSASSLAEGMYELVSVGYSSREALELIRISAEGAAAGLSTTETASKALLNVLLAYHMPVGEAQHVMDTLFETVNLGAIRFDTLANNLGLVIPSAAALKIPIEDLGAVIAYLSQTAPDTSRIFSNLNQVLTNLIKPSKEASKTAKDLGIEFGAAAVKSKGFVEVIKDIAEKAGDNEEALAKMFGDVRAIRGIFPLVAEDGKPFLALLEQFHAEMEKGDVTRRALNEQMKSLNFQVKQLVVEGLAMLTYALTNWIIPPLVEFLRVVNEGVQLIPKLTQYFKDNEQAARILEAALTGLAVAMTVRMLPALIGLLGTLASLAKVVLTLPLAFAGWLGIAALVVGLIIGILQYTGALDTIVNFIETKFTKALGHLRDAIDHVRDGNIILIAYDIQDFVQELTGIEIPMRNIALAILWFRDEVLDPFKLKVEEVSRVIGDKLTNIATQVGLFFSGITTGRDLQASAAITEIVKTLTGITIPVDDILTAIRNIKLVFQDVIFAVTKLLQGDFEMALLGAKLAIERVFGKDAIKYIDFFVDHARGLVGVLSPIWGAMIIAIIENFDSVKEIVTNTFNAIKAAIEFAFNSPVVREIIKSFLTGIKNIAEVVGAVVIPILSALGNIWIDLLGIAIRVLAELTKHKEFWYAVAIAIGIVIALFATLPVVIIAVVTAIGFLVRHFGDMVDGVKQFLEDLGQAFADKWERIKENVSSAWEAIKSTVSNAASAVGQALSSAWESIKTTVSTNWEAIKQLIALAWESIKQVVSEAATSVVNTLIQWVTDIAAQVTGAVNAIGDAAGRFLNAAIEVGKSIVQGIADGITSVTDRAVTAAESVIEAIKGALRNFTIHVGIHFHFGGISVPGAGEVVPGFDVNIDQDIRPFSFFAKGVRDWLLGGLAMLGERGPEMAFLPRGTSVATAGQTSKMMDGMSKLADMANRGDFGGGVYNVTWNIDKLYARDEAEARAAAEKLTTYTKLRLRGIAV